jgi:hypothetical protein
VYPIILENRIFCFVGASFPFSDGERDADERKPTSNERRSARLFERGGGNVAEVFEKTVERFGFCANVSGACRV